MIDLFAAAAVNTERICDDCNHVIDVIPREQADQVSQFVDWVRNQVIISINMRPSTLAMILRGGTYQNIYDWASDQANKEKCLIDDILRRSLKHWYDRRMQFDQEFLNGKEFRYAAMNAGGLGLARYSPLCLTFKIDFVSKLQEIVCFFGDSLKICFPNSSALEVSDLLKRIKSYSHYHCVVVEHHGIKCVLTDSKEWPNLIISLDEQDYFEVIFRGQIDQGALECLRVTKETKEQIDDLAFRAIIGDQYSDEFWHWEDIMSLWSRLETGELRLEII